MSAKEEKACFAAGCFWHIELGYSKLKGVLSTCAGYTGGWSEEPSYEEVCSGGTDHAEAVLVTFDPEIIGYKALLTRFWTIHNPTTLNRQGPDVGTQYRSAIFYFDEEQKSLAEVSKKEMEDSGKFEDPIVTEITPAGPFYPAEEYHQRYLAKRGAKTC
ncbi:MAG: peptide-methionine (S)-S-oxide reductase MsrA [Thermodesulfobacteriota bacterium]